MIYFDIMTCIALNPALTDAQTHTVSNPSQAFMTSEVPYTARQWYHLRYATAI